MPTKFIQPIWTDKIYPLSRKRYFEIYFGKFRLIVREENPWVCYCEGLFDEVRISARALEIAQLKAIEKVYDVLYPALSELYVKLGFWK